MSPISPISGYKYTKPSLPPETRHLLSENNRAEAQIKKEEDHDTYKAKYVGHPNHSKAHLNFFQKIMLILALLGVTGTGTGIAISSGSKATANEPTSLVTQTDENNTTASISNDLMVHAAETSELPSETEAPTTEAPSTEAQTEPANTTGLPDTLVEKLDGRLGSGFCAKVADIAAEINCETKDLIGLMQSESGVNPHDQNSYGATGLIQIMPETARELGTTIWDLVEMDAMEQLNYVRKFFTTNLKTYGFADGQRINAGDLYALTFLPGVAKNEVLCSKYSSSERFRGYYYANSGLDLDGDGSISKTDLNSRIMKCYQELLNE